MNRTDSGQNIQRQSLPNLLCCDWKTPATCALLIAITTINALALQGSLSPFELALSNIGLMCGGAVLFFTQKKAEYSRLKSDLITLNDEDDGLSEIHTRKIALSEDQQKIIVKTLALSLFVMTLIFAINGVGCANLLSVEYMGTATLSIMFLGTAITYSYQLYLERDSKKVSNALQAEIRAADE